MDDDPHVYLAELKQQGKYTNTSPNTIKFDDGNIFTYNPNRQLSKALSSNLDVYGKYNSKELNQAIKNYISANIENKSFDKKINRDFVMKKMKDDGIIDSMIVRKVPRNAYL